MDIGKWRSPSRRRYLRFHFLAYICFIAQQFQYASATEDHYTSRIGNQENKGEVADSRSKLESLNSLLPFGSQQDADYKRSGSSFFPLRGKKVPFDEPMTAHHLLEQEEAEKRSQFFPLRGKKIPDELKRGSYFMPMRGRKDGGWQADDYDITDENPNKRGSSFMPMRGKKPSDMFQQLGKAGTYDINEVLYSPSSHSSQQDSKRTSSFLPMRGKRDTTAEVASDSESIESTSEDKATNHSLLKRSVSFMPMRGRRIPEDGSGNSNYFRPGGIATSLLYKKHYSFMPMRGRRDPLDADTNNSFPDSKVDPHYLTSLEMDKKGAGFMPMRGRRDFDDADNFSAQNEGKLDTDDKRASNFMPMRGRRTEHSDGTYDNSDSADFEPSYMDDKRGSSFMPMRGRRTSTDYFSDMNWNDDSQDLDKKASSFTLMRGRRSVEDNAPNSDTSHTSPRVKRVAFMPMRGRKSSMEMDPDVIVQSWPPEDLISLFDKKSSSFMPMRGRRDFANDDDESLEIEDKRAQSFMPMRGRRRFEDLGDTSNFYSPYYPSYFMAGIGSSFMSRPYNDRVVSINPIRTALGKKKLKINWDSVKRAFHATRGKRIGEVDDFVNSLKDNYFLARHGTESSDVENDQEKQSRVKRSIVRPRVTLQNNKPYLALKRPMSFFATRGKRLDGSSLDNISKRR